MPSLPPTPAHDEHAAREHYACCHERAERVRVRPRTRPPWLAEVRELRGEGLWVPKRCDAKQEDEREADERARVGASALARLSDPERDALAQNDRADQCDGVEGEYSLPVIEDVPDQGQEDEKGRKASNCPTLL